MPESTRTENGRRGDRPRESPIFQCFPGVGIAAAPNSGFLFRFSPGGGPLNEFIFNSFFFRRNVV